MPLSDQCREVFDQTQYPFMMSPLTKSEMKGILNIYKSYSTFPLVIHSFAHNVTGASGLGSGGLGDTRKNGAKPQTSPSYLLGAPFPFACHSYPSLSPCLHLPTSTPREQM